jgi:membrane protease YdiL (CAAX protease family)
MLVPILAFLAVAKSLSWEFTIPRIAPDQAISRFVDMCVIAPVVEESIYRLVLCFPTTATIGSTGAIILSGATFAGLHFAYGNPSPDNFVAGYILAWAYLKSGSIMVPITLHSLGNSVAFAVHFGAWYATPPVAALPS